MKLQSLLLALTTLTSANLDQQVPLVSSPHIVDIPLNGFGTWNLKGDNTSDVVSAAIQAGYRHIDGATAYGNHVAVGKGIKDGMKKAGLRRDEIWITSKLWNDHHKPSLVPDAVNETLHELGLEYLDLYLMHWPVSQSGKEIHEEFVDTWLAMTRLLDAGTVRHIGICNFSPAQLDTLLASTDGRVTPYAHQFELHPYLPQTEFIEWHHKHNIKVTAYSPLGNMNPTYAGKSLNTIEHVGAHGVISEEVVPPLLKNDIVVKIAKTRGCTPAQVALKWNLMRDVIVIPKSAHAERIAENFASGTECALQKEDVEALEQLPTKRFNNPSKDYGVKLFQGLEDSDAELEKKLFATGHVSPSPNLVERIKMHERAVRLWQVKKPEYARWNEEQEKRRAWARKVDHDNAERAQTMRKSVWSGMVRLMQGFL